ncbi:MAG: hypothetical protein EA393_00790 [Bacteroidetes bacterium]|nr:MAG: hypothetical protein EA393_00790 [Bacteroidota bacterium]
MAYLVKQIENSHVVWFEKSNQWVKLDEPQWFIFLLYEKQTLRKEAVKQFAEAYELSTEQAAEVVSNIYDSIDKLLNPDFALPDFSRDAEEVSRIKLRESRTRHYRHFEKYFSITYGSPSLEAYIHLPFAHLETKAAGKQIFHLDVFPYCGRYALRLHTPMIRSMTADESPQIKRLLFVELASWLYDKTEKQWMSFVHASAVQKDGKVLLLSSASGSGKSTLAGLLMLQGFDLFSDDFVPVSAADTMLYPFPAALCIKNESVPMLESMGLPPSVKSKTTPVAYVKPTQENLIPNAAPATIFVFVNYKKGAGMKLEPVSVPEALQLFHPEAWVGDNMERAEKFIEWFSDLEFYRLEYDDNTLAVQAMETLLAEK